MLRDIFLLAGLSMLATTLAWSQPPENNPHPEWSAWFESLERPNLAYRAGCCSDSDCRVFYDDKYRQNGPYWEVFVQDRFSYTQGWFKIPPEIIIKHKENPTGGAVACYIFQYSTSESGKYIRVPEFLCFVPPFQS